MIFIIRCIVLLLFLSYLEPVSSYTVQNGKIIANGSVLNIQGVNWFGFETKDHTLHGLWVRNWQDMISQIKGLGFNAVRLPVCPDTLHNNAMTSINYNYNPELQGINSLDFLDKVVNELDRQGIYIVLDHHNPDCDKISELWYTENYSEQAWMDDLVFMAARYRNIRHFMAIDLKNEPHGVATWGAGNVATDWNTAADKAATAVLAANPELLIFVEGIADTGYCSNNSNGHFWGGNLEPVKCAALNIPAHKLVFSPHVYGPDVFFQTYFGDSSFPANMPDIWDAHFGYLKNAGYTVIIGEFGGRYGHGGNSLDYTWQNAFVDYLIARKISDFFYWSWNPNSGDTGGILQDDWQTVWSDKMQLLQRLASCCSTPELLVVSPQIQCTGGSITPNVPQVVTSGSNISFSLIPNSGYVFKSVGGTCPVGHLVDNVWHTGSITADCSINFCFSCLECMSGSSWKKLLLSQ